MEVATYKLREWREHPALFVEECFGVTPDAWQLDVLEAFPHNTRMAMKACKGPGKTAVLSWLAWNFLSTRPQPKIAATSITGDNLADNLWPEMAFWKGKCDWIGKAFEWTKTRIYCREFEETWWMSARTWPRGSDSTQQADTLAGLHAEYLLFMLDEAGGIPDAVMAAAEAGLGTIGGEKHILMAGNPTHLEGPLYRATTSERHLWHLTEITADPDDPKRTPRVTIEWARTQIEKYGKDNPWVLVNVFGKFPPSSINSLLGPDDISAAMSRSYTPEDIAYAQKRIGVDVARFGDDRTILAPRQGLIAFNMAEMRGARTQEIAARVSQAKQKWGSELEAVDGTGGYGAGVIDALLQAGHSPLEVHFSGKAIDSRYWNKRAEMWFEMSKWIKRGGQLPRDSELGRELTAPTYTFRNGKFLLESKEQIKERLGFSPDKGDALALTFCLPDVAMGMVVPGGMIPISGESRMKVEYDPFDDSRR